MPVDVVKLLKTQDAGYVRTLLSTEEKVGWPAASYTLSNKSSHTCCNYPKDH